MSASHRVYFTDRDLGKQFPMRLRQAGIHVEIHAEHFPPDAADVLWLRDVARRGWIVVTHDERIRYKPNERAAVIEHGVAMLLVVGHAPYLQLAENFVRSLSRIEAFVQAHQAPYIAKASAPHPPKRRCGLRLQDR